MFGLTPEERRVVLFLASIALIGLGISFCIKINSRVEQFVKAGESLIKMDINKVSLEDLSSAKGVSRKLAKNIIDYRNRNGKFKTIEELKEIKGIGEYRLEKLKDYFFAE
jgi:comEA protein